MISGQPVISRETRRLLITVFVSVAALWVLARIRFQERPVTSTPVPNVLAQLRPASSYADLARLIADIRPGITAAVSASAGGSPALRIREDAAVTLMPGAADSVLALDRATGLAVVRHARGGMPGLLPWVPRLLDYPRYLVAADVTQQHVALRPVFIGGLFPETTPFWSGEVWALSPATVIAPGTFLFTTEGAFAGLAVRHEDGFAIVPATLLFSEIARLQQQKGEPGDLGITIQPLSPTLAAAIGASSGVVISAVSPSGAAAGKLVATEVIEAIDGSEMRTPDHWRARVARVHAGDTLTLRVRNREGVRDVQIAAAAPSNVTEIDDAPPLGLRLRAMPKAGAQVSSVQPGSGAARAGIQEGDVITVAGGLSSPTPAQVMRAFASLPQRGSLLVAISRGDQHRVVVIEK